MRTASTAGNPSIATALRTVPCHHVRLAARPERRRLVGGLLLSIALTSFLTGVTEPIEFTFMFLAPLLYVVHAVLTGLAMVIMHALGVHLGFSFSAGLFDYVLNFSLATRPLWLLPIGAAYFMLYYTLFRYGIVRFNLATPGRELAESSIADEPRPPEAPAATRAAGLVAALGGATNVVMVDACTTRLRLTVVDSKRVDAAALARLGAMGVVRPAPTAVQVVLGPIADQIAGEIRAYLRGSVTQATHGPAAHAAAAVVSADAMLAALGGAANVTSVDCAAGRVLVGVSRQKLLDRAALTAPGVRGVAITAHGIVHIVIGPEAPQVAARLQALLG